MNEDSTKTSTHTHTPKTFKKYFLRASELFFRNEFHCKVIGKKPLKLDTKKMYDNNLCEFYEVDDTTVETVEMLPEKVAAVRNENELQHRTTFT